MDEDQLTLVSMDGIRVARAERKRTLSMVDFNRWCGRQAVWLTRRQHHARSNELSVYLQAAKLVEEVGELHAQLLGRSALQRDDKAQQFNDAELEGELADVVICVGILASILNVNIAECVEAKIRIVDDRAVQERRKTRSAGGLQSTALT